MAKLARRQVPAALRAMFPHRPDWPELPGTRDGQEQIIDGPVAQSDPCGHWHKSRQEAGSCAENLAARLNSKPMPSDYYLG